MQHTVYAWVWGVCAGLQGPRKCVQGTVRIQDSTARLRRSLSEQLTHARQPPAAGLGSRGGSAGGSSSTGAEEHLEGCRWQALFFSPAGRQWHRSDFEAACVPADTQLHCATRVGRGSVARGAARGHGRRVRKPAVRQCSAAKEPPKANLRFLAAAAPSVLLSADRVRQGGGVRQGPNVMGPTRLPQPQLTPQEQCSECPSCASRLGEWLWFTKQMMLMLKCRFQQQT